MLCPRCGVDVGPKMALCPKCSALESERAKEKPQPPPLETPQSQDGASLNEAVPAEEKKKEAAEPKQTEDAPAPAKDEAPALEGRELFYSWSTVATAVMAFACLAVVLCIIFGLLTRMAAAHIIALSAFLSLGAAAVASWFLVWFELVSVNRLLGIISVFFPPLAYVLPFIYPTQSIKPVFVHCLTMLAWLWSILIFRLISGQGVLSALRDLLF